MQYVMLPRNCKALHYNTLAHSNYTQKKDLGDDSSTEAMELLFDFCTIPPVVKLSVLLVGTECIIQPASSRRREILWS